jgi:DNA invertase Pin-like site-specific DNA recombinase
MTKGTPVVGYVRVSTTDQGDSGLGLEAQREQIRAECERRGWILLRIEEDIASGKSTRKRPGLERALSACSSGEAQGVVAAKLDRFTRSLLDFAGLVDQAQRKGFEVVVLDAGFDLSTPHGRAMAGMLATFAQLERELIAERTKTALAAAKCRGAKLGNPAFRPAGKRVSNTIIRLRDSGLSLRATAAELDRRGIPTSQGAALWSAEAVRHVEKRAREAA